MESLCDHKSVGVIIKNPNDEILLLNRARYPFGLAAPAGHIDDHGSPEQAAVEEVFEEVGLTIPISGLIKVIDHRRINNWCRRQNGDHHIWTVYQANDVVGNITASLDETRGAFWHSRADLQYITDASRRHTKPARAGNQLFEPIWLDFFTELGYVG